jgi:hypothetical protein
VRRRWVAIAPILLVTACGSSAGTGTAASCVAPQLVALSPQHGRALTSVSLRVEWLRDGCNDTNGADEESPRTAPVYFSQQHAETRVGTMTGSGRRYTATLRFDVPTNATPGPAVLSLGPERQLIARFTVG